MKIAAFVISGALLAGGCVPPPTYSVRSSALTPHMTPSFRNGQAMDTAPAELGVALGSVLRARDPEEGNPDDGVVVPTTEVNGNLRFRPTRDFDLGVIYDRGLASGAVSLSPNQPVPDGGDVAGGGVSLYYSVPTGEPGIRVGLAADLVVYDVPTVSYTTCSANCTDPRTQVTQESDMVGVWSFAIIPSWRRGRFTGFAGATLKNHPTIEKSVVVSTYGYPDPEVDGGPVNVVFSAGAEVDLAAGFKASVLAYNVVGADPVDYGPTVALGLTVPLGRPVAPPAPASPDPAVASR